MLLDCNIYKSNSVIVEYLFCTNNFYYGTTIETTFNKVENHKIYKNCYYHWTLFFNLPLSPPFCSLPRDLTSGLRKIRCAEIKLRLYYPAKKEAAAATVTTTAPISLFLPTSFPVKTPEKTGRNPVTHARTQENPFRVTSTNILHYYFSREKNRDHFHDFRWRHFRSHLHKYYFVCTHILLLYQNILLPWHVGRI